MSDFLNARGDLFGEIETSHKVLADLKTEYENFTKAMGWLMEEKSYLERCAAKIDLLNKEATSEHDKIEIGKIEAELENTMTTLKLALKNAKLRMAKQSDTVVLKSAMMKSMWDIRRKLDKITCDIVDYRFNKNGKLNVQDSYVPRRSIDMKYYEFLTVSFESTKEAPLTIQLSSLQMGKGINEYSHTIFQMKRGEQYVGFNGIEVLAVNGYYLGELDSFEVMAIVGREITTGKITLDILRRVSLYIRPNGQASCDPPGKSKPLPKKDPLGTLTANPAVCVVPAAGGTFTHQLINSANHKLVFKVKSSNNKEYRIKPVYGFIQPGAATDLLITRTDGRCSEDKLVIHYGPAPVETTDVKEAFEAINAVGILTIPLRAIA